jgi:hypothetical protein
VFVTVSHFHLSLKNCLNKRLLLLNIHGFAYSINLRHFLRNKGVANSFYDDTNHMWQWCSCIGNENLGPECPKLQIYLIVFLVICWMDNNGQ